tara:strand:- start:76 stop:519 length:444 start_codon:yes stop_codon:yes gene_type:complete
MSAMSDYLESGVIDHLLRTITFSKPSNISIALLTNHDANWLLDSKTGVTIPELASANGYARKSLGAPADSTWDLPGTGSPTTSNTDAAEFAAAAGGDWGHVSGIAIVDSLTHGAGNVLFHGALTTPREVTDGDTFKFNAGDIDITLA